QEPSNLELQARVVLMLSNLGRLDDAVRQAAGVIVHFRSSADSLAILRLAFRGGATPDEIVDELSRLQSQNPDDRTLLLALADVLRRFGRYDQAASLLRGAAEAHPDDDDIARTLIDVDLQRDDVDGAARAMVLHLAAEPDSLPEFSTLWAELLRPLRTHSLRLATLQSMQFPANARAAQLYLVSKIADFWMRDALARSSLEAATNIQPPFAPAYRELATDDWQRRDWDATEKKRATDALAARADSQGDAVLAAEVRGIAFSRAGDMTAAATELARAIALGSTSPDTILSYADVLHQRHQDQAAAELLEKLLADRPGFSDGWAYLFQLYHREGLVDQTNQVLRQWLIADPSDIDAWLYLAVNTAENGDIGGAQAILLKLFADHSDNEEVIQSLLDFYKSARDINGFTAILEEQHRRQPANRVVAEWLVRVYSEEGRTADAVRVIESTRAAVGSDPDQLYQIAELYELIQDHDGADSVLQQVLKIDPRHAGASNDLGFDWADHGVHLARAEALIRVAVAAEPDNQSFLDSMGWVLYKEGKFADAAVYMKRAIGPAALPDPEVIDHYGDILYRMGKTSQAVHQWQWALQRVDQESADRDDLWQLRQQLVQKLDDQKAGRNVSVAPLGIK
ncbi:MAG TPA: tetratricopeptide repeat protein, partial [Tepidisphaeraceae bacterium]|nr:tetratricopeptide repeat protein [Tepidisphaeraceae bacterium]